MAARLGQVLYWFGCGLAGLLLVSGVLLSLAVPESFYKWMYVVGGAIAAILVWLIGRAFLYVLAGR